MLLFPQNEPIANSFQVAYYSNSFCIPQVQNRPQNSEIETFQYFFSTHYGRTMPLVSLSYRWGSV